jgi:hypothetical protein
MIGGEMTPDWPDLKVEDCPGTRSNGDLTVNEA